MLLCIMVKSGKWHSTYFSTIEDLDLMDSKPIKKCSLDELLLEILQEKDQEENDFKLKREFEEKAETTTPNEAD